MNTRTDSVIIDAHGVVVQVRKVAPYHYAPSWHLGVAAHGSLPDVWTTSANSQNPASEILRQAMQDAVAAAVAGIDAEIGRLTRARAALAERLTNS